MQSSIVIWALFSILCVVLLWLGIHNVRARLERQRFFHNRGILSLDEWYAQYFKPLHVSCKTSHGVCAALAKSLDCHFTQFRPSDRFDAELRCREIDVLGFDPDEQMEQFEEVELFHLLGEHAVRQLEERAESILTVGDLVCWCDSFVTPDVDNTEVSDPT